MSTFKFTIEDIINPNHNHMPNLVQFWDNIKHYTAKRHIPLDCLKIIISFCLPRYHKLRTTLYRIVPHMDNLHEYTHMKIRLIESLIRLKHKYSLQFEIKPNSWYTAASITHYSNPLTTELQLRFKALIGGSYRIFIIWMKLIARPFGRFEVKYCASIGGYRPSDSAWDTIPFEWLSETVRSNYYLDLQMKFFFHKDRFLTYNQWLYHLENNTLRDEIHNQWTTTPTEIELQGTFHMLHNVLNT